MDLLEEYRKQYILSEESILSAVDEWCLYLYYLENNDLQLNTTYRSPVRNGDLNPSFSIYENTRSKRFNTEFLWKDSALNLVGDIWTLLELMFGISRLEVLELVNKDFDILESNSSIQVKKRFDGEIKSKSTDIRIKSKWTIEGIHYWNQLGVSNETIKRYNIHQVEYVWYSKQQEAPFKVDTLTFAYLEWDAVYKRWRTQLYSPFALKEFKFRSDYNDNIVMGFFQLKYKYDTLIINKSKKDIATLDGFSDELQFEVTSPRSETTMIPDKFMRFLIGKYKRIIIWLDPDSAGWNESYKYKSLYPEVEQITIYPCLLLNSKDVADYRLKSSREATRDLIKLLI